MAPKYIEPQSLEPVIVTLCGKGALLDVNKLRVLRWGGVITGALKLESLMAVAREKDVMIGTGSGKRHQK